MTKLVNGWIDGQTIDGGLDEGMGGGLNGEMDGGLYAEIVGGLFGWMKG